MILVNNILARQKSPLLNNSGIALPLVLMLLVVFTLLGTTAYTASQSSLKQSARLNPDLQCKYLARSAVDATKEAWTAKFLADPSKYTAIGALNEDFTFYTRYDSNDPDDKNHKFIQEDPANAGKDGVITTVQTFDASAGICTVTSTVSIGSHSATVTAESEKLNDADVSSGTAPWYECREYESRINGFIPSDEPLYRWDNWTIIPGPSSRIVTDKNGQEYTATYHVTEGIVNISTYPVKLSGVTLYANGTLREEIIAGTGSPLDAFLYMIDVINFIFQALAGNANLLDQDLFNYSVTGLQAKHIRFNCPLDLYYNTSLLPLNIKAVPNPHSLIVCAETIVFQQSLTIGDSAFGNLTLSIPPGTGIPGEVVHKRVVDANATRPDAEKVDLAKIDLTAKYGLVRFNNVVINGSLVGNLEDNDPAQISNKSFFFRVMGEKALGIGTEPNTFSAVADLFGWTATENDCRLKTLLEKGYLIPATDDDVSSSSYYDVLFFYK